MNKHKICRRVFLAPTGNPKRLLMINCRPIVTDLTLFVNNNKNAAPQPEMTKLDRIYGSLIPDLFLIANNHCSQLVRLQVSFGNSLNILRRDLFDELSIPDGII